MSTCADTFFGPAYVDVDEWHDRPIRHRYVHGGFAGTDTRFACYFPESRHYRGRSLQWLEGGAGGHEGPQSHTAEVTAYYLDLATSIGAYLIESNQGHIDADPGPPDATITTYRANAATARQGHVLAADMYGDPPHHNYLFGGSGGGMRSILCMENTSGLWDGAVPFVAGIPDRALVAGVPTGTAVMTLLGSTIDEVVDALEPGASGDPYEHLGPVEAEALRKLFDSGFQRGALFQFARPTLETLFAPAMITGLDLTDPGFVEDFWQAPGYAGADGDLDHLVFEERRTVREFLAPGELRSRGVADPTSDAVSAVAPGVSNPAFGLVFDQPPPEDSQFATVRVLTGDEADAELIGRQVSDGVLLATAPPGRSVALRPGDEVTIDNRRLLAYSHHHRYAVARGAETRSSPIPMIPMTGRFEGKMILVNAVLDAAVIPPVGTDYDRLVREQGGGDRWRFWLAENAGHVGALGPPGPRPVLGTRLVRYTGLIDMALHDLVTWVEGEVEPPPSTAYDYAGGQLELPAAAAARGGVQPVVTATVNGGRRAVAAPETPLTFTVHAEVPAGGGTVVGIAWDFDGSGDFAHVDDQVRGSSVEAVTTHVFTAPGVYFPVARVETHHDKMRPSLGRVFNLARVRVVVE